MYVIYGKENCPACIEAKALIEHHGHPYEVRMADKDFTLEQLYEIAPRSHRSYPMVTLNGEYLGGIVTLRAHMEGNYARQESA